MARLSLLTRTLIALFAVGVVPLAIVSWRLIGINREGMTLQIIQTHALAAKSTAERIAAFLASRRSLADAIASNEMVAAGPRSTVSREVLQNIMEADPDVAAIVLNAADGAELIRLQRTDKSREMTFLLANAQKEPFAILQGEQEMFLAVRAPLRRGGSLRLVTRAAPMIDALKPQEIGDQAEMVVAGPAGEVKFGSVQSLTGFPPSMVSTASIARTSGSGSFKMPDGREVLGAYSPVGDSDWYVLSRQPGEAARVVESGMRRNSALALAAALLLGTLIAGITYAGVVRPIRQLVRAQRRVAGAGNVQQSGDEIKQLESAFALLEKRISDQEELDRIFLGRYQVLKVVGEGGMGTVFRGWDPKLQRAVALKTIRLGAAQSRDERHQLVQTLVNEAVTVARFSHPNIVSVYDVEESENGAFIAMELIDGVSLEKYLWRHGGRVKADEVTLLGVAMARGLAAAHERGIIHRDMKPANVLLDRNGAIKVTDFGIADLLSELKSDSGLIFGTPGYIPPECVNGGPFSPRGDLFSMGVILYECATGVRPFEKGSMAKTLRNTLTLQVPSPRSLNESLDAEIDEVILKLLQKQPEQRYATATEVADVLDKRVRERALRWSFVWPATVFERPAPEQQHAAFVKTRGLRRTMKLVGLR
ncbi:MAG TPA: serine/threonine protein kinase [Thermoanaerobaculia bacterium]|nr:serine/threonine protein kinase [Thermoanaerobaculia bacterium]